jgi:hypothetical protein
MDALKATYLEASEEVARIDARISDKLLKRARKQGMTSQDEANQTGRAVEACRGAGRPKASPTQGTLICPATRAARPTCSAADPASMPAPISVRKKAVLTASAIQSARRHCGMRFDLPDHRDNHGDSNPTSRIAGFAEMIERLFSDVSKLELFARVTRRTAWATR